MDQNPKAQQDKEFHIEWNKKNSIVQIIQMKQVINSEITTIQV